MTPLGSMLAAVAVLAAGTLAFRFAGPVLRSRSGVSIATERIMNVASVVLLTAVVVTAALIENQHLAGWARPAGVAVGGVLAWRRAPFVVTVVAAAAAAAGLRWLGVG